jgi:hypothetical protein
MEEKKPNRVKISAKNVTATSIIANNRVNGNLRNEKSSIVDFVYL